MHQEWFFFFVLQRRFQQQLAILWATVKKHDAFVQLVLQNFDTCGQVAFRVVLVVLFLTQRKCFVRLEECVHHLPAGGSILEFPIARFNGQVRGFECDALATVEITT